MNPARLHDLANIVLGCVCTQMENIPDHACPCLTYVAPGAPALDDEACCGCKADSGLLTVHIEGVYGSESFPTPAGLVDPCRPAVWVAEMIVTVARCVPTMDETGRMPDPVALTEAARTLAIDHHAVLQAAGCCLPHQETNKKRRVALGAYRSLGEQGGCAGFSQTLLIQAGHLCGCDEDS